MIYVVGALGILLQILILASLNYYFKLVKKENAQTREDAFAYIDGHLALINRELKSKVAHKEYDLMCNQVDKIRETLGNQKERESDPFEYLTANDIVESDEFPFTQGQIRFLLLNRKKNGLEKAVRKVGKNIYIRKDLFIKWIETEGKIDAR